MDVHYGLIARNQMAAFLPLVPEGRQMLSEQNVFAVGAVKDGQACGVLAFRADELAADILYLAVAEPFRRQGIANGLIDFLCRSAWKSGTAVLCSFSAEGRNDPLCRLLTRRGDFTLTEEASYLCRFPCRELASVRMEAALPGASRLEPFYHLPKDVQHGFFTHLKEDNTEFLRGLQGERMLEPLCLCVVEHGVVQAAVFCQNQDGNVLLSFVYERHGHVRAMMALVSRLRELLLKASEQVPYLYIAAVTPESRKLVDTLLPQREIVRTFYTASWDENSLGGDAL